MSERLRFKTEAEFKKEFGKDWRHTMGIFCFHPGMDYLLGQWMDETDCPRVAHRCDAGDQPWTITKQMTTSNPMPE